MNSKKIARDVLLRRFGLERSYRPPALLRHPEWNYQPLLKLVVGHHLRLRPDFNFLQVGAFDGLTEDPIRPLVEAFGIRGIVVEPQRELLETLKTNYAAYPQVVAVNAAIADADGARDFYVTTRGPSRKASFFRSHLLKHGVPEAEIEVRRIPSVTIASVLARHGMDRCDFIQIDAEGYDYQIVRTIDFQVTQPLIVSFEHAHMSNRECNECIELLASHGFRFIGTRRDIIALREPARSPAPARLRVLAP